VIHTSHHTHYVIGSGANDPQKYDPRATRETLDHSIPYIVAVALQDGEWHHERSYAPERAARPDTVALWHKISTAEDPEGTRRYHTEDPAEKAFGGRMQITLAERRAQSEQTAIGDARPLGARRFERDDYVAKFHSLADGVASPEELSRFLQVVTRLGDLAPQELRGLTVAAEPGLLGRVPTPKGLL